MERHNFMVKWIKKHWEVLSYLVFGVLCTLLNIVLYALFNKLFRLYTAANSWGNVLDNILCILFAYCNQPRLCVPQQDYRKGHGKRVWAPSSPAVWVRCCWTRQSCWCWAICWLRRVQH